MRRYCKRFVTCKFKLKLFRCYCDACSHIWNFMEQNVNSGLAKGKYLLVFFLTTFLFPICYCWKCTRHRSHEEIPCAYWNAWVCRQGCDRPLLPVLVKQEIGKLLYLFMYIMEILCEFNIFCSKLWFHYPFCFIQSIHELEILFIAILFVVNATMTADSLHWYAPFSFFNAPNIR